MRDIGLNIGNSILALVAALCLGAIHLVLVLLLAGFVGLAGHDGFAVLGILLYIGFPTALLCVFATSIIFYDKLNNP